MIYKLPTSGTSSTSIKSDDTKLSNAEQKRRCTIKNGFEFLRALVPSLSQTPNVKISKAALLTKGAEYVMQLRDERESLGTELDKLRKSVEELNICISGYQAQLPTGGKNIIIHTVVNTNWLRIYLRWSP